MGVAVALAALEGLAPDSGVRQPSAAARTGVDAATSVSKGSASASLSCLLVSSRSSRAVTPSERRRKWTGQRSAPVAVSKQMSSAVYAAPHTSQEAVRPMRQPLRAVPREPARSQALAGRPTDRSNINLRIGEERRITYAARHRPFELRRSGSR